MEGLYQELFGPLSRWCAALARDPAEGEDICQETFLRALRHIGDLENLSREQQKSWLYQTAKHIYIDRLRKKAWECLWTDLTPPADDPGPGQRGEGETLAAVGDDLTETAVAQLVGRLPGPERRLFVLRYFQGYNASELGERFGLPPATVRSRLLSARRRIRGWLEEDK